MFLLHYLLMGALAFMGALNSLFRSSVVLYNSSVFDLVLELPVMAYFVAQKNSVSGTSEPVGIFSNSATEQCTWGIPGLLALRPVALPPSALPRVSRELTVYRPEGTGLTNIPTKAASATGNGSHSFEPLSSQEDEVAIDMSLLPVEVLKKKTRSTRRTWSALGTLYLLRVYLALLEAVAVLYVIYCVDQAFNFGDFELLVDFSELFPQATATQANNSEEDIVLVTAQEVEQDAPSTSVVADDELEQTLVNQSAAVVLVKPSESVTMYEENSSSLREDSVETAQPVPVAPVAAAPGDPEEPEDPAPVVQEEPELPVDMSMTSMVGGIYQVPSTASIVPSTASVASFPSNSDMSECSMVSQAVVTLSSSESSETSLSDASVAVTLPGDSEEPEDPVSELPVDMSLVSMVGGIFQVPSSTSIVSSAASVTGFPSDSDMSECSMVSQAVAALPGSESSESSMSDASVIAAAPSGPEEPQHPVSAVQEEPELPVDMSLTSMVGGIYQVPSTASIGSSAASVTSFPSDSDMSECSMVSQAVAALPGSESSETSMSDASVAVAAPSDSEEPELPVDMSLASMVGGIYHVPSSTSIVSSAASVTGFPSDSDMSECSMVSQPAAALPGSESSELPVDMSLASMVGGIYQVPSTASVASFPSDSDMSECSMVSQAVAALPGSESSESSMSDASVVGGILSIRPTQLAEAQSVMTMYTDSDMDICSLASSHHIPTEDSQSQVSMTQYLPPIEPSESDLMVETSEASPQVNSSVHDTIDKSTRSDDQSPEFILVITEPTEDSVSMTETPVASNLDNVDGTSEQLDISALEVASPLPEITANLQTAPSFNNVLESSICTNASSKDSLSVVELSDLSFESMGSVSDLEPSRFLLKAVVSPSCSSDGSFKIPKCDGSLLADLSQGSSSANDDSILYGERLVPVTYPGRLSWTRKAGDVSLAKLADELAPFAPTTEASFQSVCIEDMGFTAKTLLNELPLKGSLSKDNLSFSPIPEKTRPSQSLESFRIPECDNSMLVDVSRATSSTNDDSILYGIRPVPTEYPDTLRWKCKTGDISLTKVVGELAPFVPTTEASLQSVCIEDMGFIAKTLLDESSLKGSPTLDSLSFSQPSEEKAGPSRTP